MTSFRWITTGEKQPENCVFELRVIVYDGSRKSYPCDVSTHVIGLFSSSEKAEAQMCLTIVSEAPDNDNENDDMSYADCIHHFEILARPLDRFAVFNSDCEKRVYDDLGRLLGVCLSDLAPFAGKKPEECQFKTGDIVEVARFGKLRLAIVSLLPINPEKAAKLVHADQSDNVYCIQFADRYGGHDHIPECEIFKPRFKVSARCLKKLREIIKNN